MERIHDYYDRATIYLGNLFSNPMRSWDSLEWFVVCLLLFISLAMMFPGKRGQPHFRKDMVSDGMYWFLGGYIYGPVFMIIAGMMLTFGAFRAVHEHSPFAALPLIVQALLMLLISDFFQYWIHRGFHKSEAFWKFHAIHHSSKHVDWLSSARFHPVNIILYSTVVNAFVAILGFSMDAVYILVPFNALYSPLVHANLKWNYGPFKYLLASPVFHRWHHTHTDEGGDKNFAPTFPFIDLMFGTFYMPKGVQPENFGTPHDPITGNIVQQLIYPFLTTRKPALQEPVTVEEKVNNSVA